MSEDVLIYAIKSGDCLSNIAERAGLRWKTIWQHPENAGLREQRQDPNVLYPGDRLAIPLKKNKEVSKPTAAEHVFVKKGTPTKFRLRLLQEGEPRAGIPFTLLVDGDIHQGKTDSQGYIILSISAKAAAGKLILTSDNGQEEKYDVLLGHLDPLDEIRGVQKRLRNLGFKCEVTGVLDETTKTVIAAFRARNKLAGDGMIDQSFKQKLYLLHGS